MRRRLRGTRRAGWFGAPNEAGAKGMVSLPDHKGPAGSGQGLPAFRRKRETG